LREVWKEGWVIFFGDNSITEVWKEGWIIFFGDNSITGKF